jgi:hypothetical protein
VPIKVGIEAFWFAVSFADIQAVDKHAFRERVLHPIFWHRVRVQKLATDSAAFGFTILYDSHEYSRYRMLHCYRSISVKPLPDGRLWEASKRSIHKNIMLCFQPLEIAPVHSRRFVTITIQKTRFPSKTPPDRVVSPDRSILGPF